jgi:hypothetical protein
LILVKIFGVKGAQAELDFWCEVNMDILYIGLMAAFVALSVGLVYGCDKLMRRPK